MKIKPATKRGQVIVELNRKDESILGTSQNTYNKPTPFSLKDILVPIDFSDCSKKALRYAVPFAKQFGATITLLHVVHVNYSAGPEFGAIDFPLIEADLRKSAEKQLAELAATEIQQQAPAQTLVRIGQEVAEISTHGRTGLKHVFMGSVAENVIRRATCPVLVVREQEHEFIGN